MYRKLDPERIVATVQRLRDRIHERFPDSSLGRVADEFLQVTGQAVQRAEWLSRPNYWLRVAAGGLTLALLAIVLGIVRVLKVSPQVDRATELFQAVDAALNTLILLSGAIYFLVFSTLVKESALPERLTDKSRGPAVCSPETAAHPGCRRS